MPPERPSETGGDGELLLAAHPADAVLRRSPACCKVRLESLPDPRGVARRKADKTGYYTPCGVLPGATTVLGRTSAGKERLEQWLKRPDAQSISDAAKARGTWTHASIEQWIDARSAGAEQMPDPKHFAFGGYWRNIRPWLEQHWELCVAQEKPVFHPSGYAGSFDALGYAAYGREPELLTLFDWKTSKSKRDETLVEDYFCQLGAYAKGIRYVYGVAPERALLVIARPHGPSPDIWELSQEELYDATARFEKRLRQYYELPKDDAPAT